MNKTRLDYGDDLSEFFIDDKYVYSYFENELQSKELIEDDFKIFSFEEEYITALNEAVCKRKFKKELFSLLEEKQHD